jgi:transposase
LISIHGSFERKTVNKGKFVFAQLVSLINRYEFDKCVLRYDGDYKVQDFNCWCQFLTMIFGQLTHRESIRDIITCLNAHQNKVYHLGIKKVVAHSTLTRANENRDWHIYKDFATYLIDLVKPLYHSDNDFDLDLDNPVYALDSTTIDLCLSMFKWAKFRKAKGAVKLHTLLDLKTDIPVFIHISDGKMHDVNALDMVEFTEGAFYVMDKAYIDFARLYKISRSGAFFVTRGKENLSFRRLYSSKVVKKTGLRCDQTIKLNGYKSSRAYPIRLRRIKFYDAENQRTMVFITNNFDVDALTIALLYKHRWQIELFFKWIKQHLRIKIFWGTSANAVKTQVWIAVCTYLLIAYAKKQLKSDLTLYEITQIISVSTFDKTPLYELLTNFSKNDEIKDIYNQLNLFDL